MKIHSTRIFLFVFAIVLFLTGCLYGQCINGPCALEHSRIVQSIKPYGAHWVKEGMTRESRRIDLSLCGSTGNEDIQFTKDQLKKHQLPEDPNEINSYFRLRDKLGECMRSQGYQPVGDLKYLGGCDERCMYP